MIKWCFALKILIMIIGLCFTTLSIASTMDSSTITSKITEFRFAKTADKTQVILSMKPVTPRFKVFTLTNPNRVVIDFKNTQLATSIKSLQWKGLPIVSIRTGHPATDELRLVIEVATTHDATLYAMGANKLLGDHLVIDLKPSLSTGLGNVHVLSQTLPSETVREDNTVDTNTNANAKQPEVDKKLVTLPPVFEAPAEDESQNDKSVKIKYDNHSNNQNNKTTDLAINKISENPVQQSDPAAILEGHVPEVYSQPLPPAISAAERNEVKPASETFQPPASPVSEPPVQKSSVTLQEEASSSDLESPVTPPPQMSDAGNKPKKMIVVVIDPGHGGKDPGAKGYEGYQEKNVVLAIARQLQARLNQHQGIRAVLTRKGDYYITLRERLRIARLYKADLFLAIHADAFSNPDSMGSSVFALSLRGATSEAARWLAEKENYSELGGVNLGDKSNMLRSVLIDLSQTATISASLQLGSSVLQQLGTITSLHKGRVEQARFVVLKSPDIPSLLIETGFISNPREERRLTDRFYQDQLASAIEEGIRRYYVKSSPVTTSFAMNFYKPS
jgi:N-acetylmuramoyl-L-alanine amidase